MFAEYLKTTGDSQVSWARRLNVSNSHLCGVLSGKKKPSLELAVRIERETGGAVPASSWIPEEAAE